MSRLLVLAGIAVSCLANPSGAGDAIAPKTLAAIKRASVYVKVITKEGTASGSGFVVHAQKDQALIVTNLHVADPGLNIDVRPRSPKERPFGLPSSLHNPRAILKTLKDANITVVFDSGVTNERSYKTQVVAIDAEHDLAVLRIEGAKDLPVPIDFSKMPELTETMPVYTFGFPFGKALATGTENPAITVGKAVISSLRTNHEGDLAIIQIDGSLNPGNSGGPMVDARGQLVGVAVATIRNSIGIGLAIPATEVRKTFQGRLGSYHLTAAEPKDGKVTVTVDVNLVDPLQRTKSVSLLYLPASKAGDPQKPITSLEKAATKIELTIDKQLATGTIVLDASAKDTSLLLQGIVLDQDNKAVPARVVRQTFRGEVVAFAPPVEGSREYTPKNKRFTIMLPPGQKSGERTQIYTMGKFRIPSEYAYSDTKDGSFIVGSLGIPAVVMRDIPADKRFDTFRDMLVKDVRGNVISEIDIQQGTFKGKDYRVERPGGSARVHLYLQGGFVFWAVADVGKSDDLESKTVAGFLSSFKMTAPDGPFAKKDPDTKKDPAVKKGTPTTAGGATRIVGGAFDPEFADEAPNGAVLIGLEIGLDKAGNSIKAIRAIYRTDKGEEIKGPQFGNLIGPVTTLNAKEGYAIGAVKVNAGLWIDSVIVTFMRVKNDRLDSSDSYLSDSVGGKGGGPTILAGDGTPIVGIIGKSNKQGTSGFGLILKKKN